MCILHYFIYLFFSLKIATSFVRIIRKPWNNYLTCLEVRLPIYKCNFAWQEFDTSLFISTLIASECKNKKSQFVSLTCKKFAWVKASFLKLMPNRHDPSQTIGQICANSSENNNKSSNELATTFLGRQIFGTSALRATQILLRLLLQFSLQRPSLFSAFHCTGF